MGCYAPVAERPAMPIEYALDAAFYQTASVIRYQKKKAGISNIFIYIGYKGRKVV